jgi:hypothetical protein
MADRVGALFAQYLSDFGALAPRKLGEPTVATDVVTPTREDINRFLNSIETCRRSTKQAALALFLIYFVILVGMFFLLFANVHGSSVSLTAILGGSGVASLAIIPLRMHALWKDLTFIQLTLAMLPGHSPPDQLNLIKSLYLGINSATGS